MMDGLYGILWQEMIVFKRKFWATTIGFLVSPILYLVAFGWGLGDGLEMNGMSYMAFIIPGIIAMNTMMTSFSNTANSINISRLYYKTFEYYMISPINMTIYALGKIIAGAFYGIYSGLLIVAIVSIFTTDLVITPYFIFIAVLNCFVFSTMGFLIGLVIDSHADMSKFMSFVVTPMSFLSGTFFPIDKMPEVLKWIIYLVPLTHTNLALRNIGESPQDMLLHAGVLIVYLIVLFVLSVRLCKNAE